MDANSRRNIHAPDAARPIQDEWGIFDPQQAGMASVLRNIDQRPAAIATSDAPATRTLTGRTGLCPYCTEPLPSGASHCPVCRRDVDSSAAHAVPPESVQRPRKAQAGAVYAVESPVRCPSCDKDIRTLRVIRVLRTQVSFTSTLPRKGYIITCPECDHLLSAELSGLI